MARDFFKRQDDGAGGLSPGKKEDTGWRKKARHPYCDFYQGFVSTAERHKNAVEASSAAFLSMNLIAFSV